MKKPAATKAYAAFLKKAAKRRRMIMVRLDQGWKPAWIAADLKISRERVRQIIAKEKAKA